MSHGRGKMVASLALTTAALSVFAVSVVAQSSQQEMMEAWLKLARPGEQHKLLEPLVGTFSAEVTTWEAPGAAPVKSTATSENRWVLGGRFVYQVVKGTFAGEPFEGIGYLGYDNAKKAFVGVWMDSLGTGFMTSEGTVDSTGKLFTFTSEVDDPVSGKKLKFRETLRVLEGGKLVSEMFLTGPDGKEFKNMEIHYTRR